MNDQWKARTSTPTAVASSEKVNAYFDEYGRLHVMAGGMSKNVDASFTRPADTTAYAVGDVMANSTSSPVVITFAGCARVDGGSGIISQVQMVDSSNTSTAGDFQLWLFDTSPTIDNDNATWTPTDAALGDLIGIVALGSSPIIGNLTSGAGGNAVYQARDLNLPFTCGAGVDDIYGVMVAQNAYVPISAEVFDYRLRIYTD